MPAAPPPFSIQPVLTTDRVRLEPLQPTDWAELYAVAADPKIWEQHPAPDRWQHAEFRAFFDEALQSGGAFKIVAPATGAVLGSTRVYGYAPAENSILVGYTFYGRAHWGTGLNPAVKALLLDYLFQFVDTVRFEVGAYNRRSQIAVERLGATRVAEEVTYYGGQARPHVVFAVRKRDWLTRPQLSTL